MKYEMERKNSELRFFFFLLRQPDIYEIFFSLKYKYITNHEQFPKNTMYMLCT